MAVIFALEHLYTTVKQRFTDEGSNVPHFFGWRTPPQRMAGVNRICWVPGDDEDAGAVGAARFPGGDPRPLATLGELFTVYLLTADLSVPSAVENELVQYRAARALFDAWYRAVHLAAVGTFTIERVEWLTQHKERRHGAGLKAVCLIEAMIPDEPLDDANEGLDVEALMSTTVLDRTEQDTIEGDA